MLNFAHRFPIGVWCISNHLISRYGFPIKSNIGGCTDHTASSRPFQIACPHCLHYIKLLHLCVAHQKVENDLIANQNTLFVTRGIIRHSQVQLIKEHCISLSVKCAIMSTTSPLPASCFISTCMLWNYSSEDFSHIAIASFAELPAKIIAVIPSA